MIASPHYDDLPVPSTYATATAESFSARRLPDPGRVPVAVIGGGITGLAVALTLAESGVGVLVLESKHVGAGASGRAFGQVVPYSKHGHDWTMRRFGAERGREIMDFIASGPDLVYALIDRHKIDCNPVRAGTILAAHHSSRERDLIATARYWQSRNDPVELLEGSELAAALGSDRYRLAMLDRRSGTLDVLGYVRGLARAAANAGATIVEACPVQALAPQGGQWYLSTPAGEICADTIVLATNAYSDSPWPALGRAVVPTRGYCVVSRPLDAAERAGILPGGQSLTDTRRLFSGIRMRSDGRLQASSDGPPYRLGAPDLEKTGRRVMSTYPQLRSLEWEESWAGWIAISPGQFPSLHRLADNAWAALGYSGRGIALATLLGREIAHRIAGERNHPPIFPVTPVAGIPSRTAAVTYARALIGLYRILDRWELRETE